MGSIKVGIAQFSIPKMVRTDWYWWQSYERFGDIEAVYILRGEKDEVLYVGYTAKLKTRLEQHLYGPFRDEIKAIEYIAEDKIPMKYMIELEKILYFLLKPRYCKKKILPHTMYSMKRQEVR
ncbi:GIY-YIG nuclease family protein [Bacillus licheniformis]|uniref:GIY-YIG nuclease family protein n=1 Tax=Bacillus licheniformis TaxID=1402 RepID=UPI001C3FC35B|nr:GIY-YIG nuclease family protein [Bacillus licheniformis]MEC2292685.1 GIY-YIG nuclease family protein [Bacillus licheniformis]